MTSPELQQAFAEDVVFLRLAGLRPVVVHGGGPQITAHLDQLGIASEFRGGLRVTTPEAMDVVRMVLTGQVNPDVVNLINDHGAVRGRPVRRGRRHADRRAAAAPSSTAKQVDIGQVGDVVAVDPSTVQALLDAGRIPVIATVARGLDGLSYNVNADTAAAAVAVALERREADRAHRRRGALRRLAGQQRGHQPDPGRRAQRAAAGPGRRHDPEDGGVPAGGRGRRAARARPRRPGAALAAARSVHHRGHRHDGAARRRRST